MVLSEGKNDDKTALYGSHRYFQLDELPKAQRIGDGGFMATCNSLHLTSTDGICAVNFVHTDLRPQFLAIFPPTDNRYVPTRELDSVHLKKSDGVGFICDEAATLPSDLVLIASRNELLLLDHKTRTFSTVDLPVPRKDRLLVRILPR
jgi:hypothetical protein